MGGIQFKRITRDHLAGKGNLTMVISLGSLFLKLKLWGVILPLIQSWRGSNPHDHQTVTTSSMRSNYTTNSQTNITKLSLNFCWSNLLKFQSNYNTLVIISGVTGLMSSSGQMYQKHVLVIMSTSQSSSWMITPLRISQSHCHRTYISLYFLLLLEEKNNLIYRWIAPWDSKDLSLSLSLSLSLYIYIYIYIYSVCVSVSVHSFVQSSFC